MNAVLTPQALSKEALQAYQQGDYAGAARSYQAAAEAMQSLGHVADAAVADAAEMRNNASVAWLKAGKAKQAYEAVEGTPQIFAALPDPRRQGIALGNLAAALEALHRPQEAMDAYEQAIEILQACGEKEYRAYALKSLAALKLQSGKQIEGLTMMDISLDDMPKQGFMQKLLKQLLKIRHFLLPR